MLAGRVARSVIVTKVTRLGNINVCWRRVTSRRDQRDLFEGVLMLVELTEHATGDKLNPKAFASDIRSN